ncbi:TnsA endonuclease N-terminal domain-containing protein [Cytobacillus firmus]|uniref:TnsA endonuclease N-terminal domain-containing protein n=1 Tax=Cytobacillus firmus TaxID=1399 RepID=UPI0036932161
MTIKDIKVWCSQKGLSDQAIKEIEFIRNSEPSRRVRSRLKNVSGFYPSKKMGLTIQFESRTVELAAIYEKEHDETVIEYYDQPPSFRIKYLVNGKNHGHLYTPDFFVISDDWIGWEEWKTEEELLQLVQKNSNRYCLNEKGQWISPPAEDYVKSKDLSFRIRLSKEINWTYQRNIRFLEDYLSFEAPKVSDESKFAFRNLVKSYPGITINEILNNNVHYSPDDLYTLLASDELYIDMYDKPIPEYDLVNVYVDEPTAHAYKNTFQNEVFEKPGLNIIELEVGNKIQWDGRAWTVINLGEHKISLLNDESKVIEIPEKTFKEFSIDGKIKGLKHKKDGIKEKALAHLINADKQELEKANQRYGVVIQILNGVPMGSIPIPDRTLRDWIKKYREAKTTYGYGFIGLISKIHQRGNRTQRLNEKTMVLMKEYIDSEYETITQKTKSIVYKMLVDACEEKGYPSPSFKTFCLHVDKQTEYERAKNRTGRKAAYNKEPFYWYLEQTTPRHGDRPFEIAHIDHTQLDIELVCSTTGKVLGRPWATFMVDAYSRRILSSYLTYDEPSYRSDMMVLKECVKRHGRLPKVLVVDGGKDFQSTYFETFLACYEIQKQVRPPSKPRFGSVCERLFGTANKNFIHNLVGNTQIMTNIRQVSKEVLPKTLAVWTLPLFAEYLFKWVYEIYDSMEHSTLGQSPRDVFLNGIAQTGYRKFTLIGYDEVFRILTLPTTKKGTAKVQPGRGVKINRIYYWSNLLYDPGVEGKQVEVRFDPFNMGIAYAYIKKRWVLLHSEFQMVLSNRTEKEIQIAFEELRQRKRVQGQNTSITSKKLVDFLRSAQGVERLQMQRLKDQEVREALTVLEGGISNKTEKQLKSTSPKNQQQQQSYALPKETSVKPNHRIIYGEF